MDRRSHYLLLTLLKQTLYLLPAMVVSVALLLAVPCMAGDITLTVESTTRVTGQNVDAQFRITNNGTERAVDVALTARFTDQDRKAWVADAIPPGNTETASVDFQLPQGAEGTFPVFAKLSYLSLENMPYSSGVLAVARTPKARVSKLQVYLKHRAEKGEHRIQVELRDPSSRIDTARLVCHVPDDLSVITGEESVALTNSKAAALFHVENLKGLPGSRYGVFVTAAYEQDGLHYLAYSSTTVPIDTGDSVSAETAPVSPSWRGYLIGVLLLIACGSLAAFSRTRKAIAGIFQKKK